MQASWKPAEPDYNAEQFEGLSSHTPTYEPEIQTDNQHSLAGKVEEMSVKIDFSKVKGKDLGINDLHIFDKLHIVDVPEAGRSKIFTAPKFFDGAGDKFIKFCVSHSTNFKNGLKNHWESFQKWRQEKTQSPIPDEIAPQQVAPSVVSKNKLSFFTAESKEKFEKLNPEQKKEFVNRLFAHLGRNGMNSEGVFRLSPSHKLAQQLLNNLLSEDPPKLDSNKNTDIQVSAIIKEIYGQNPIFSRPNDRAELRDLAKKFAGNDSHQEKIKMAHDFISRLSQEKQDALYDLMAGLDPIMKNVDNTKMDAGNLATVFGPRLAPKELTEVEGVDVLDRVLAEQLETKEVNNAIKFIFENHQEIAVEDGWIMPGTELYDGPDESRDVKEKYD